MTVIAVRDGIMAADSRATEGGRPYVCDKLFEIKGRLVGVAGENCSTWALIEYFRGGEKKREGHDFKEGSALVLCPKRGLLLYDGTSWGDPVHEDFYAIGSGAGIALGSMQMGATAEKAVQAAIRWDVFCGGPVKTMRVKRVRTSR